MGSSFVFLWFLKRFWLGFGVGVIIRLFFSAFGGGISFKGIFRSGLVAGLIYIMIVYFLVKQHGG